MEDGDHWVDVCILCAMYELADTRESLVSGYVAIAGWLDLPEKDEQDQSRAVEAVKHWFTTHTGWLLIFDNIEDLVLVDAFLPSVFGGHLLPGPERNSESAAASNASLDAFFSFFMDLWPPLCGWSEVTSQVALTYAASVIVGLAAQAAGRPDLIRSPKRVLAHLWERDSQL